MVAQHLPGAVSGRRSSRSSFRWRQRRALHAPTPARRWSSLRSATSSRFRKCPFGWSSSTGSSSGSRPRRASAWAFHRAHGLGDPVARSRPTSARGRGAITEPTALRRPSSRTISTSHVTKSWPRPPMSSSSYLTVLSPVTARSWSMRSGRDGERDRGDGADAEPEEALLPVRGLLAPVDDHAAADHGEHEPQRRDGPEEHGQSPSARPPPLGTAGCRGTARSPPPPAR